MRSRCEASWRRLLGRYGPRIRCLVRIVANEHGLDPSRDEVDELCQELYLYWLGRGTDFRGRTVHQFWCFVGASVRHLVIDQVRRVTAGKRALPDDPWSVAVPVDDLESGRCGAAAARAAGSPWRTSACWPGAGSPERGLIRRQELQRLWRDFAGQCREVIGDERAAAVLACVLVDGHSSRELSRALRCSDRPLRESTIDTWVHRLRKHLEDRGLQLPRRPREPDAAWPPHRLATRADHKIESEEGASCPPTPAATPASTATATA